MKGIVVPAYGPAETSLVYKEDLPLPPDPQPDQVLVRVMAAGTNPIDYKLRNGDLAQFMKLPLPCVIGLDLAGVVEKVGAAAAGTFKVGDAVYGRAALLGAGGHGSYAEYALARARDLDHKPSSASFEQAAALPVAALTALVGLKHYGGLKAGQRVLVFGGSGGVGTMAVQLASKALGAGAVAATCSTKNIDFVTSLGATEVYDYSKESSAEIVAKAKPDVVLDCVGGLEIWSACRKLPASCRFVTAVGDPSGKLTLGAGLTFVGGLMARKAWSAVGLGPQYHFISSVDALPLTDVSKAVQEGKLSISIEETLPLQQAPQAHSRLESHRTRGKVVLTLAAQADTQERL